jgi:hypothetical protein
MDKLERVMSEVVRLEPPIRVELQAITDRVADERERTTGAEREYGLAITKLDEAFMWLVAAQNEAAKARLANQDTPQ